MDSWMRARVVAVIVGAATIVLDRATKLIAISQLKGEPGQSFLGDTFRLVYVENTGGFLSLGAALPDAVRVGVFTVATGVVLTALVVAAIRYRWTGARMLGLGVVRLRRAPSNWVDRVSQGSVVGLHERGDRHAADRRVQRGGYGRSWRG